MKKLIESSLNFANIFLSKFDQLSSYWNADWKADSENFVRYSDKIVAETFLYLFLLERNGHLDDQKKKTIINSIEKDARSERNASIIMRYPQFSCLFGLSHVILNKINRHDEDFDFFFKKTILLESAMEKVPFRSMDENWVKYIYTGEKKYLLESFEFYNKSILKKNTHPIYMQRESFYALTHCIMYLTDFGNNEFPFHTDVVSISNNIEDAIKLHLHENDFDLLSELILSYLYINGDLSEICIIGVYLIVNSWRKIGFLPSRSFCIATFNKLEGNEKEAYYFLNTYHTLFVSGILLSESIKLNLSKLAIDSTTVEMNIVNNEYRFLSIKKEYLSFYFKDVKCEWIAFLQNSNISELNKIEFIMDIFLFASIRKYDIDVSISLLEAVVLNNFSVTNIIRNACFYLKLQKIKNGTYGAFFSSKRKDDKEIKANFAIKADLVLKQIENLL